MIRQGWIFLLWLFTGLVYAETNLKPAITTPIPMDQIKDFLSYPGQVKKIINEASFLSNKNLTYQYGSDDPNNKGMDCSGTMYYLLNKFKVPNLPRDSDGMYQWVQHSGRFHLVKNHDLSSPDFSALRPGDLLFWTGTYANHSKSISHVMLYLGKNLENKPIMFGSSDGRTYQGKKMWGVSVFDFQLPNEKSNAKFVGYSCIPALTC